MCVLCWGGAPRGGMGLTDTLSSSLQPPAGLSGLNNAQRVCAEPLMFRIWLQVEKFDEDGEPDGEPVDPIEVADFRDLGDAEDFIDRVVRLGAEPCCGTELPPHPSPGHQSQDRHAPGRAPSSESRGLRPTLSQPTPGSAHFEQDEQDIAEDPAEEIRPHPRL